MPRDKRSERERLLTLIDAAGSGGAPEGQATPRASAPGLRDWLARLRTRPSSALSAWTRPAALVWVNRALAAAIAAVLGFAAFDLARTALSPDGAIAGSGAAPSPLVSPAPVKLADLKTLSGQAERLFDSERTAPAGEGAGLGAADAQPDPSTAYRLVGVDWGGEEPVALIEDVQTAKTYFKRRGDRLGGHQLVEIQRKKVVLEEGGRKTEIQ